MSHYVLLDKLKLKLRLQDADETLSEELEAYMTDIDSYINRKLRSWLGLNDVHGNPIILPLTEFTNIPIDDDIMQLGTDLAYGKFRKEQNNEELNWENAVKNFEDYLVDRFGWASEENFRVDLPTTIDYVPVDILLIGESITISGKNYHQFKTIQFFFNDSAIATTPETVFADAQGKFKNVKIVIPDNLLVSKAYTLKAQDGTDNQDNRASTYVSVNVDAGTNFTYIVDAITLGSLFHNVFLDGITLGTLTSSWSTDAILT